MCVCVCVMSVCSCAQDNIDRGIADNVADVFHTFFGIGGLSLLGLPGLNRVSPAFAVPDSTLRVLGIDCKF